MYHNCPCILLMFLDTLLLNITSFLKYPFQKQLGKVSVWCHHFLTQWIFLSRQSIPMYSKVYQITKNTSWSSRFFKKEEDEGLFIRYSFYFCQDGRLVFQIKQATNCSVWTHHKLNVCLFVAWGPVLTLLTGSDYTKKRASCYIQEKLLSQSFWKDGLNFFFSSFF